METVRDLVRRSDPDRFLSSRVAPPELRPRLWSLYAFNVEVSRAPWVASDPGLAAIRLQWWADAVREIESGDSFRRHDVCEALRDTVVSAGLPTETLLQIVKARHAAVSGLEPKFNAIGDYVSSTSASVTWLAALALGAPRKCELAAREFGWGAGMASLFRAEPRLASRGRSLFGGRPELVQKLASAALSRIASARSMRQDVPNCALAAMLAGWRADRALQLAAKDPGKVERGELTESEFRRRATLSWRSLTGRW